MGADLYIKRIYERTGDDGHGYYRESYGRTMVGHFGLSWWRDIQPRLRTRQGKDYLMPSDITWLAERLLHASYIENPPPTLEQEGAEKMLQQQAKEQNIDLNTVEIQRGGPKTKQEVYAQRDELLAFLARAALLKEKIECRL